MIQKPSNSFQNATDIDSKELGLMVQIDSINTTAYKPFFTNRVVNVWNKSPYPVLKVDSINTFHKQFG